MGEASEYPDDNVYYPPRGRWTSRFYNWSRTPRVWLNCRLSWPRLLTRGDLLLSIAVPGYVFRVVGAPKVARYILAGWFVALVIFVATLGHFSANLALGMMTASHVFSLTKLIQWVGLARGLKMRFVLTAALLGGFWMFLYFPLREALVHHLATPVKIRDQVVMINPRVDLKTIQRGEPLAYEVPALNHKGIYVLAGGGIESVLAAPGDTIEFVPDGYLLNGVRHDPLPLMPTNGIVRLGEMHWFFWPRMSMVVHGSLAHEDLQTLLQRIAVVPGKQIIGRPYHRWLGVRQTIP